MIPVAPRRMRRHEPAPAATITVAPTGVRPETPRWSRRRGVVSVFAGLAVLGFAAAYVGPMGSVLAEANAAETTPVTLYASGLGDTQSLSLDATASEEAAAFDRGGYTVYVKPKPTPTPTPVVGKTTGSSGSTGAAKWTPPFISPDPGTAQSIAYGMVQARGWGDSEFACLVALWNRESGWRVNAYNAGSGAYGIPQALPGSKMGSIAPDWESNPATQITWGLNYIGGRYGSPCGAWNHSQSTGWY